MDARERPRTLPRERKRYEQAVTTAWSSAEALETKFLGSVTFSCRNFKMSYLLSPINVVVTPIPFPKADIIAPTIITWYASAIVPENKKRTRDPVRRSA